VHDGTLALVKDAECPPEGCACLGPLQFLVDVADRVDERRRTVCPSPAGASSEVVRSARAACTASATWSSLISAQPASSETLGARSSSDVSSSSLIDLEHALLQTAGQVDGHHLVPEVTLQLTEDGGHGERTKARATFGIEAIDRLHQAKACDLEQVLEWLAATPVAQRQRPRHRHESPRQLVASRGATFLGLAGMQSFDRRQVDLLCPGWTS
jgi:hypothetical protein